MAFETEQDHLEALLRIVTSVDLQIGEVGERRLKLLLKLAQLIDSPGGFWGWGRGRPGISAVSPVASIPFGYSNSEWASIASVCLSEDGQRLFQEPIFARIGDQKQVTVTRVEIVDDETWYSSAPFLQGFKPANIDHLLSTVRFCSTDIWCCLTFSRRLNSPAFGVREVSLINMAMSGITWLHPQASEAVPPEVFMGITPKQRVVMLFLLDGMSRKQIANRLGLTLHTVNDHVKALYAMFGVQSATELAARFLRSV